MKINIRHLINYDDVISYKIPEDNNEYIASIIGEPDLESESTLFFATNTIDYKWYTSKTDRSVLVRRLSKYKKNWIFVIGDKGLLSNNSNYYILVRSVNIFVEKITKKIIGTINKRIIAITGSVGKSTLSKLLSLWIDRAQLIDVKRLTPLNLADFIFNRLKSKKFSKIAKWLDKKVHKNKDTIEKYGFWGLVLFVGIPLPGTGAWTGTLAASLLDLDFNFKSDKFRKAGRALLTLAFGLTNSQAEEIDFSELKISGIRIDKQQLYKILVL